MNSIRFHRGFSLIELLVGVVISIIASMIIFQVFATAERQKRATTGAADSQTNGAIATYMIERDVKMAGWGLVESAVAGCSTVYSYFDDGVSEDKDGDGVDDTPSGPVDDLFASVAITDGGASPDSLSIRYYDNPSNPNFKFALTTLSKTMPQSSSILDVTSVYGCADNSLAIVRQGGNCTLMQITHVSVAALKLEHNPGGKASYNPPVSYQNTNEWPAYTGGPGGATMQCFSQLFKRIYRINSRQLELIEPDSAGVIQTMQIAPEIVDFQAEYGVAAVGSQQVNAWVPATGSWASPLSTTDTARIKAVRVALVARSAQADKPDTAGACTTTTSTAGWSSWASFSTVSTLTDWKCYRYKVFETVIPLRNIIWANL